MKGRQGGQGDPVKGYEDFVSKHREGSVIEGDRKKVLTDVEVPTKFSVDDVEEVLQDRFPGEVKGVFQKGTPYMKGGIRMVMWTVVLERELVGYTKVTQRQVGGAIRKACEARQVKLPMELQAVKEEEGDERNMPQVVLPAQQEEAKRQVFSDKVKEIQDKRKEKEREEQGRKQTAMLEKTAMLQHDHMWWWRGHSLSLIHI